MLIVYAVPIGLLLGAALGGRLEGLASLAFRWGWLALAGLAVQVVLFSGAMDGLPEAVARGLYVGSTAAVLVAVLRNLGLPGLPIVAVGAVSNLAAIVANGGAMPADPAAYAAAGLQPDGGGVSNSYLATEPALRPLTDVFALPAGLPLANVFSIGDVLIGVGIVVAIAGGMRRARHRRSSAGDDGRALRASNSPD